MTDDLTPTLYLKRACPFCLKLRIFLTEAGLAARFRTTVFDDGDATHQALRARFAAAGQEPGFPAAELAPGALETGTDALIARFARDANGGAGVDPAALPLLRYYTEGVFPAHTAMFKELRELKGAG